jgi:NAD(P)-dependent dehydrogenase (short-subunit alcohol dehydrogenase family)
MLAFVRLHGGVAVITGGASGIGRATARVLARRGMRVVVADVNRRRLGETEAELTALGTRCLVARCDVSRDADVEYLARRAFETFGAVDLLMNNAGVVVRGALEVVSLDDWRWQFEVNLFGQVRGVRALLPHMLARGTGHIVNTGSMSGMLALTGEGAPYIASKFGVVGFSEALALYTRPRGIGVSVLCPGSVDTNLAETGRSIGMTPEREVAETAVAQTLQGNRLQQPEDVAEAVAEGVEQDRFLILPDPDQLPLIVRRAQDLDAYLDARVPRPSRR